METAAYFLSTAGISYDPRFESQICRHAIRRAILARAEWNACGVPPTLRTTAVLLEMSRLDESNEKKKTQGCWVNS